MPNARPRTGGTLRLLTCGLWESGPLYDARLRTIAQVLYKQRPSAIILRGVNSEGLCTLKKSQIWSRLRISQVDIPQNALISPSLAIVAAGDTVITVVEPLSIGEISDIGIYFRATTASDWAVLISIDPYQLRRHFDESGPPTRAIADSNSEYIRWASGGPGWVYVAHGFASDAAEAGDAALIHHCVDAWRYMKPEEPGYTYDGAPNACAQPGIRRRPLRIFCSADLTSSIRGATLVGTAKCAKLRAIIREG